MTKPIAMAGAALVLSLAALFLSLRAGPASEPPSTGTGGVERASAPPRSSAREAVVDDSDVGLRRRVAALEAELASLRRRLDGPTSGGLPAGSTAPSRAGERAAIDEDILEAIEADPEVRERLEDLVSESLRKEDERRWENRRARWEERASERLDELAEKASLTPEQVTKLSAMLSAERQEMGALFQKAREEGGGWREMREQMREIRARTDENARAVLDEEQLPAYEAMREEERPGRGPRGRDRDGREERDDGERGARER